jgi:PAS domain S-box-containing protein
MKDIEAWMKDIEDNLQSQIHHRLMEELVSKERRYREMLEGLRNPVVVLEDGCIVFLNPAWMEQLGYELQTCLGASLFDYVAAPYRVRLSLKEADLESITSGGNYEIEFLHHLGHRVWYEVTFSRESDGTLVAMLYNIDERYRAIQELKTLLHAKQRFLACMSHELRTPLNSILGFTTILSEMMDLSPSSKQVQYLKYIDDAGQHLLALITDILDAAKIETGEVEQQKDHASLAHLMQAALRMTSAQGAKKGGKVSLSNELKDDEVEIDSRRFIQILTNLLTNAIKFSSSGKSVILRARQHAGRFVFEVVDQGTGIANENLQTIFEPFVQVDAGLERRHGGTGLGLYLVKILCEMMDGTVEVSSRLGDGATFKVSLPLQKSREQAQLPRPRLAGVVGASKTNWRVLVVEDDDRNRLLLQTYLKAKGYDVLSAENGQEGIDVAVREMPDLILMDVRMPVMDGLKATERLSARADTMHIPVIAVTAQAMAGDVERCLAAGARDYTTKPIDFRKLDAIITNHLDSN